MQLSGSAIYIIGVLSLANLSRSVANNFFCHPPHNGGIDCVHYTFLLQKNSLFVWRNGENACRRGVYNSWEKTMIEGRKAPLAAHMFISPKGRRSISKEKNATPCPVRMRSKAHRESCLPSRFQAPSPVIARISIMPVSDPGRESCVPTYLTV